MRKVFFVMCCLLVSFLHAEGQRRWKWIGPPAGSIRQIVPDRRNPHLWFLINNHVLYRSTSYGRTWEPKPLKNVVQVTIHPVTSEVLVLTASPSFWNLKISSIWSSTDQGATFHLRAANLERLRKLFVHPTDPRLIYGFGVSDDWPLAVSLDGGVHWPTFDNLPPIDSVYGGYYDFEDLLVSPFDPKTIYVSGRVREDYYSWPQSIITRDGGKSWNVDEVPVYHFHTDPAFPERAFAFNCEVLRELTTGGWKTLAKLEVGQLAGVPGRPKVLYAVQPCDPEYESWPVKVLRSIDEGKSWEEVPLDLLGDNLSILAVVDDEAKTLLAGTRGGGVYRRRAGQDWVAANSGFREAVVTDVEAAGLSPWLFAVSGEGIFSSSGRFLYRTENSGKNWSNLSFQVPLPGGEQIVSMEVDPNDPHHVILTTGASILVSDDRGKKWTEATGITDYVADLVFDPIHSNTVYFTAPVKQEIYTSTDGGSSIEKLLDFRSCCPGYHEIRRTIVDENNSRTLYFPDVLQGIFKSIDGGRTVRLFDTKSKCNPRCEGGPSDMAPLPEKDSYLMVTSAGEVYRIRNGGERWERISKIPDIVKYNDDLRILAADRIGNRFLALYWSDAKRKLLESTDGGRTWKDISTEFGAEISVYDITDPRLGSLYVATSRGVFMEVFPL